MSEPTDAVVVRRCQTGDREAFSVLVDRHRTMLFGTAYLMAREVDTAGRVIVDTTHRERAELKRDEINSFGADPLIPTSRGSMHAVIEPAVAT